MYRTLLKSKVHRVSTTHSELQYEGSCAIDEDLLDVAGIVEKEQLHIWNIANGERFITYATKGERGTGVAVSVNGSAASHAAVGDLLIIAAFAKVSTEKVAGHKTRLVFVHASGNRQKSAHDRVHPVWKSWLTGGWRFPVSQNLSG